MRSRPSASVCSAYSAVRVSAYFVSLVVALSAAFAHPAAQSPAKKAMIVDDYTRWRSIGGQEISGDGKWVAYVLQLTNVAPTETKPVLHLRNLQSNDEVTVADATGPAFSSDSKWLAYTVDPGGGRGGRGRGGRGGTSTPDAQTAPAPSAQPTAAPGAQQGTRGNQPPSPPQRVALRNLATGAVQSWQDIQSFVFSPAATHLVLKRRPASAAGAGAGRGGDTANGPTQSAAGPAAAAGG